MFFSSDTKSLAAVGELVRIVSSVRHNRPYRIIDRFRDRSTGQVFIDCEDVASGDVMPRQKIEPFSFWPSVGDAVLFSIAPYLNWLADQQRIYAGDGTALAQIKRRLKAYGADREYGANFNGNVMDLLETHVITHIDGLEGIAERGADKKRAPLHALIVTKKEDGRKAR